MAEQINNKLDSIESIVSKLKELYSKQDKLLIIAEELNEEIEMLEYALMYVYNRKDRINQFIKK